MQQNHSAADQAGAKTSVCVNCWHPIVGFATGRVIPGAITAIPSYILHDMCGLPRVLERPSRVHPDAHEFRFWQHSDVFSPVTPRAHSRTDYARLAFRDINGS